MHDVRPDAIYHLAALTHVGASWSNQVEFTRVNVAGHEERARRAHERRPRRERRHWSAPPTSTASCDHEDLPLVRDLSRGAGRSLRLEQGRKRNRSPTTRVREHGSARRDRAAVQSHRTGSVDTIRRTRDRRRLLDGARAGPTRSSWATSRRAATSVTSVTSCAPIDCSPSTGVSGEVYNIASGSRRGDARHRQSSASTAIAPHVRLVTDESLLRPVGDPGDARQLREDPRATTGWEPTISLDTSLHDVIDEMRHVDAANVGIVRPVYALVTVKSAESLDERAN